MLRTRGIRSKILAVMALPYAVLVAAAALISVQAVDQARQADVTRDVAQAAPSMTSLAASLQNERALTVRSLLGDAGATGKLKAARGASDRAVAAARDALSADTAQAASDSAAAGLRRAAAADATLPSLRGKVDKHQLDALAALHAYDQVLDAALAVPTAVADGMADRDQAATFATFGHLARAMDAGARAQLAGSAMISGTATPQLQAALASAADAAVDSLADVTRTAAPDLATRLTGALGDKKLAANLDSMVGQLLATAPGKRPAVAADAWTAATTERAKRIAAQVGPLSSDASKNAADVATREWTRTWITIGVAAAVLLLSLVLGIVTSARLARPLRRLTSDAHRLRGELPAVVETLQHDPGAAVQRVVVGGSGAGAATGELAELTAALQELADGTIGVAVQQAALRRSIAEMFVNIARRNQTLLSRQLAFIDQLERTEENPDTLDNLFRLDHLATRMRRNAESLLVLSGIESGRRLRRPMPMSDVIRTATSEIEHYDRISLALQLDPQVVAHLALPTAHLLAELLENATHFSDPGSYVMVTATLFPMEEPQWVRIAIADDGLGMTADELADANARIQHPSITDAVGSQRLGFFVVGRLAQRLEAGVGLHAANPRGTIAVVDLPLALFVASTLPVPGAPGAPGGAGGEGSDGDAPAMVVSGPVSSLPASPGLVPLPPVQGGSPAGRGPGAPALPPAALPAAALAASSLPALPVPGADPSMAVAPAAPSAPVVPPPFPRVGAATLDALSGAVEASPAPVGQLPRRAGDLPRRRGDGEPVAEAPVQDAPVAPALPTRTPAPLEQVDDAPVTAALPLRTPAPIEPEPVVASAPVAEPVAEPAAGPLAEPVAEPLTPELVVDPYADDERGLFDPAVPELLAEHGFDAIVAAPPSAVAAWAFPEPDEPAPAAQAVVEDVAAPSAEPAAEPVADSVGAPAAESVDQPATEPEEGVAARSGLFSGFRSRREALRQDAEREEARRAAPPAPVAPAIPHQPTGSEELIGRAHRHSLPDAEPSAEPVAEPVAEVAAPEPEPVASEPVVVEPEPFAVVEPEPVAETAAEVAPEPLPLEPIAPPLAEPAEFFAPAELFAAPETLPTAAELLAPLAPGDPEPLPSAAELFAPVTPAPAEPALPTGPEADALFAEWPQPTRPEPAPAAGPAAADLFADWPQPEPARTPEPAAAAEPVWTAPTPEAAAAAEPVWTAPTPEPAAAAEPVTAWTPPPAPEVAVPVALTAPEPIAQPYAAWTQEPAASQPQPEPQPEPEHAPAPSRRSWVAGPGAAEAFAGLADLPVASKPDAVVDAPPPAPEPIAPVALVPSVDVLPARHASRGGFRLGRRKTEAHAQPPMQPTVPAPSPRTLLPTTPASGASSPAAPRHGAPGTREVAPAVPAARVRPREEGPRHSEPSDSDDSARSKLASEALSELSALSSYRPSAVAAARPPLARRQPVETPPEAEPIAATAPTEPAEGEGAASGDQPRRRNAADVRSMLTGFHAGVERGRTSPSAHRPVPGVPTRPEGQ